MRILCVSPFLAPAPAHGGMARAAAALAEALARRGHAVTVITSRLDARLPEREQRRAVEVIRLTGPRWLARHLFPVGHGLASHVEGGAFDVAHLHGVRTGLVLQAASALRRAGVPWVVQPHGTWPHHGQRRAVKAMVDAVAARRAMEGAASLLAVSAAEARDLPRSSVVVGNGVEAPGRAEAPPPRTKGGARPILFVGSSAPQKRLARLLEIVRDMKDARLEVVGPTAAAEKGAHGALRGRVAFRGVLDGDALAAAYAGAGVVAHPARGEAFGLVPFEAALCGTAAVVAGGHGCGEWFARAGGCVIEDADDLDAWRDALLCRLADPALARAEAERVADFARRELTWDRVAEAVEAEYCRVLDGRAP